MRTLPLKSGHIGRGRGRGSGDREGATHQPKRFYCCEMPFKHDLSHDVRSISNNKWLKKKHGPQWSRTRRKMLSLWIVLVSNSM